jgi:hypothetical protein
MICELALVVSSFSLVALLASEVAAVKIRAHRAQRVAMVTIESQRRVLAETRAVLSQLFVYCWRLETMVGCEGNGQYRDLLDSRPPVVPLLMAIDQRNWPELERIRQGRT